MIYVPLVLWCARVYYAARVVEPLFSGRSGIRRRAGSGGRSGITGRPVYTITTSMYMRMRPVVSRKSRAHTRTEFVYVKSYPSVVFTRARTDNNRSNLKRCGFSLRPALQKQKTERFVSRTTVVRMHVSPEN